MSHSARDINKMAEADGIAPPFSPDALPHWATARDGADYVAIGYYPRTIDELRKLCREYGEAAVADFHWGCVIRWLMSSPHEAELTNPLAVVTVAVQLANEADRIRLGWPTHDGRDRTPPTLDRLSPDVREEAERVAAETLADWRRAGKPYFGPRLVKTTYQYVTSCPAFIEKYVQPLDETKEQE